MDIVLCTALSDWSGAQLSQVFKNYADAHPESWNDDPAMSILWSLDEACPD
jgi:hypothetical protein